MSEPAGPMRRIGAPDEPILRDRASLGVRELVEGASRVLAEAGVGSPRVDATELAAFALGLDRLELVLAPPAPAGFATTYAALVERRRLREPLQHITGRTGFRYLTMVVEPGVFVPRPETEVVAQAAIDEAARLSGAGERPVVVDLCCGAGGIAVSVATEVPTRVWAVDASPAAVALTRRNAELAGGDVVALDGDVRDATLLAELDGTVDVLVSNPPYIPPDAVPVDPEVRDHDPDLALYGGGADGLDIPRAVIEAAARLLKPGGLLVMEHAEVQDAQARAAAEHSGAFAQVATLPDLTGRPRMLVARRNSEPRVKDSQP